MDTSNMQMLLSVLAEGEEQTKQLEAWLGNSSVDQHCKLLVQQIQCHFHNAITIAKIIESNTTQSLSVKLESDSPRTKVGGSMQIENPKCGETSINRNKQPKRSTRVYVAQGEAVEAIDDGYSWRKYGQKDILGATHPRGYYRCTHRNTAGCTATKQVQRSDENPCVFDITYRGDHTCMNNTQGVMQNLGEDQHLLHDLGVDFQGMDIQDRSTSMSFSFPATLGAEFMNQPSTSSPTFELRTDTENQQYFSVSQWPQSSQRD